MNLDDASLFPDAMEDVQPLENCADVHRQPVRNLRTPARVNTLRLDNFFSTGFFDIVPLNAPLESRREGLQGSVTDKLRNRKYPQQTSLNLIRQLVEVYHQMPFSFILQAQQEGLRNVLVIYGKGRNDSSHANITRSCVAHWLMEFDGTQTYYVALPCHGGNGACYVVLHKTAQAKQDNWEYHAKRSR